ncbi:MAG TPA: hypothetical protein P5234_12305 [Thermoanaerobaculaceae bacterium]|nr:hypothetical protein [Thermoanaerobaculaceae bacterium]HRS17013.1 hypothetical protein [Thermoanaerobaculaceae bacterium]
MKARSLAVLVLASVGLAAPLAAQDLQYDLAIGYQWIDLDGNQDVHRTQTGEREGFRLDSLNLLLTDTKGAPGYDRLRLAAAGLGSGPDQRLRLDVGRHKLYSVRFSYTRAEVFNSLPGYANPLLGSGIVAGQHTLDRRRQGVDLDVELFPNRLLTPLFGFSRHTYTGPARTTLHFGQDEFRLASDLDETVAEYRVGLAFAAGAFRGAVVQGWRSFDSVNHMTLVPGAGAGNNPRPVLGEPITADGIALQSRSNVDTPFTNAYITGRLFDRVRLVGSYVRADAKADIDETGEMTGRFASFALQRFFGGATQAASGRAENLNWRGEGRIEVEIVPGVDLVAGYRSSHRELDGHSLVTERYLDTVNFSGALPQDITQVLTATTAWERDEDVAEAKLVVNPVPWLRLWGSAGKIDQSLTITPALAEIVVPGNQGGTFERDIDRLSGGAELDFGVIAVGGDWSKDDADRPVVRTDFTERTRLRGRVTLKLSSLLRVRGVAERIESSNPTQGIGYNGEVKHWGANLEFNPIEAVTIRGAYDRYRSDSRLAIFTPYPPAAAVSAYAEDGRNLEGSVSARLGRFTLGAGANRYTNEGDFEFDLDRTFARFDVGITEQLGVYGQFERRTYDEKTLPIAGFEADRYGLFLRWSGK